MTTSARCLSINVRNKTAIADIPRLSRHWSRRLPQLIKFIQNAGLPSVIGVQECRNDMAVDLTNGLGPNWTFWGRGTSKIIWDTAKWVADDQFQAGLPYQSLGLTHNRPITMVKLRSIKTGESAWFAVTHLTVNVKNEAKIRQDQIRLACQLIKERPDNRNVIFMGDFNDSSLTGVRKIASDLGYKPLRARLSAKEIRAEKRNTFNGWKITKREGRWIDDVLTCQHVEPYAAAILITDSRAYQVHASDHNGVLARLRFSSDVSVIT